jgi:hypothetical protein
VVISLGNMANAQNRHILLGKVLYDHQRPMSYCVFVQKKPAVSCLFLWKIPSRFILEASDIPWFAVRPSGRYS